MVMLHFGEVVLRSAFKLRRQTLRQRGSCLQITHVDFQSIKL